MLWSISPNKIGQNTQSAPNSDGCQSEMSINSLEEEALAGKLEQHFKTDLLSETEANQILFKSKFKQAIKESHAPESALWWNSVKHSRHRLQ